MQTELSHGVVREHFGKKYCPKKMREFRIGHENSIIEMENFTPNFCHIVKHGGWLYYY